MNSLQKYVPVHANVHNHFSSERYIANDRPAGPQLSGTLSEQMTAG
jgi:hypothetical protein